MRRPLSRHVSTRLSGQPGVAPRMEEQRCLGDIFVVTLDPPDEDGVVTARKSSFIDHFKTGTAVWKNRSPPGAGLPGDTSEAVDWPGGEAIGEIFLIKCQDVDGVVAGATEGLEIMRGIIETPEYQRRVKRDGTK